MSTSDQRMTEQILRATQRVAQLRARQLLKELRAQNRRAVNDRQTALRQKLAMGASVLSAGCGDLTAAELVGMLRHGRERMDASPTARAVLEKRGLEYLAERQQHTNSVETKGAATPRP